MLLWVCRTSLPPKTFRVSERAAKRSRCLCDTYKGHRRICKPLAVFPDVSYRTTR